MMKIGCNTVAFRRSSLDFALQEISTAGYKYVEVEANLLWCPHVDPWKDDPYEFKKKVESYGFEGGLCNWQSSRTDHFSGRC